jgi:hypothetical protein
MSEFKQRLIEEHRDLAHKLNKLQTFLETDVFSNLNNEHQTLLTLQENHMNSYLTCLTKRISLLQEEEK